MDRSGELIYYFTYFSSSSYSTLVCFFPVGLLLLIQHFQQVLWVLKFLLSAGLGSWQLEFKSQIIVMVGFQNFVCYLVWAVYFGVQITDEGRSLYIGSFCPTMTSLSRYLEEAAFSIYLLNDVIAGQNDPIYKLLPSSVF